MDDPYQGLAVGDQVLTVEGWQVEIVELTTIEDGAPWVLIPSQQPRVMVRALDNYGDIRKGDVGGYHPSHLTKR